MKQLLFKTTIIVSLIITFTSYLFLVSERIEKIENKESLFQEELLTNN